MHFLRLHVTCPRLVLVVVLACLGLMAGTASAASSGDTFTVGSPALNSSRAESSQEYKADGHQSLKCGSGEFVYEVLAESRVWGTYPDLSYIRLHCVAPAGLSEGAGTDVASGSSTGVTGFATAYGGKKCAGTHGAVDGLYVNSDRYTKDIKIHCAVVVPQSGKAPTVESLQYSGWLIGQVESNDVQKSLRCAAGQVVTGVYIGYKHDSDEYALTSLQLYCSTLAAGAVAVPPQLSTTTVVKPGAAASGKGKKAATAPTTIEPVTTVRTPRPVAPRAATSTTTDRPAIPAAQHLPVTPHPLASPATPHQLATPAAADQPKRPRAGNR